MTRLLFINPSKTLNAAHSNYKRKFRLKLFRLNDIQPILDKSFVSPYILKNDKICSVKNQNLKKIVFLCWNKTKFRSSQSGIFEISTETFSWGLSKQKREFLSTISLLFVNTSLNLCSTPFFWKFTSLINNNCATLFLKIKRLNWTMFNNLGYIGSSGFSFGWQFQFVFDWFLG